MKQCIISHVINHVTAKLSAKTSNTKQSRREHNSAKLHTLFAEDVVGQHCSCRECIFGCTYICHLRKSRKIYSTACLNHKVLSIFQGQHKYHVFVVTNHLHHFHTEHIICVQQYISPCSSEMVPGNTCLSGCVLVKCETAGGEVLLNVLRCQWTY